MEKLRDTSFKSEGHKPDLLRPIRAFQALDISKSRGYEALQRGEIPFIRVANQIRIPRSWIEQQVKKALAEG